jgi:hypothetical protein
LLLKPPTAADQDLLESLVSVLGLLERILSLAKKCAAIVSISTAIFHSVCAIVYKKIFYNKASFFAILFASLTLINVLFHSSRLRKFAKRTKNIF